MSSERSKRPSILRFEQKRYSFSILANMFRRVSIVPRIQSLLKARSFSDEKVLPGPVVPKKKYSPIKVAVGVTTVVLGLVGASSVLGFYQMHFARKFVTEADLHEYRSLRRNAFQHITNDNIRRMTIAKRGMTYVEPLVQALATFRIAQLPIEKVKVMKEEADNECRQFLRNTFLSFDAKTQREALDKFNSFYYTYDEREEAKKRQALGDGAASGTDVKKG